MKKKSILLLLGIFVIILLITAAFSFYNMFFNTSFSEPDYMKSCSQDSDCISVESACNSCCAFIAINKNFLDEYSKLFSSKCESYTGPVCDCMGQSETQCSNGICEIIR